MARGVIAKRDLLFTTLLIIAKSDSHPPDARALRSHRFQHFVGPLKRGSTLIDRTGLAKAILLTCE